MALQYASAAMRSDRDVVMRAVTGFLRGQVLVKAKIPSIHNAIPTHIITIRPECVPFLPLFAH
eukprot:6245029-Amphidinium_carterae.2